MRIDSNGGRDGKLTAPAGRQKPAGGLRSPKGQAKDDFRAENGTFFATSVPPKSEKD